jgi:hypothetical protein
MRFLSAAACALAASLLSASPSQALTYEIHSGGTYTVVGEIPSPIEVTAQLFVDATWLYFEWNANGYEAQAWVNEVHLAQVRSPSGYHFLEGDNTFDLSDTNRTISIGISAWATPNFKLNDVYVSFNLPDNLSIAAPVPEISTWLMLILGFATIAFMARRKAAAYTAC